MSSSTCRICLRLGDMTDGLCRDCSAARDEGLETGAAVAIAKCDYERNAIAAGESEWKPDESWASHLAAVAASDRIATAIRALKSHAAEAAQPGSNE